jgi:hypothetical protein
MDRGEATDHLGESADGVAASVTASVPVPWETT